MHRSTEFVGDNRADPQALADPYIFATRHVNTYKLFKRGSLSSNSTSSNSAWLMPMTAPSSMFRFN